MGICVFLLQELSLKLKSSQEITEAINLTCHLLQKVIYIVVVQDSIVDAFNKE